MKKFLFTAILSILSLIAFSQGEMDLDQGGTPIAVGGSYDFGGVLNETTSGAISFNITNSSGIGTLTLNGTPDLIILSGTDADQFSVDESTTASSLPPLTGNTTTFTITFSPTSKGVKNASISIPNTDSDENPYDFTITGTGTNNPPTGSDFTAGTIYQNTIYTFATADFGYLDTDSDPLVHVRITAVPANGSLWIDADDGGDFNEAALTDNTLVTLTDLDAGRLKFLSDDGVDTNFTFDVNDGTDYSSSTYTATLTVVPEPTVTLSLSGGSSIAENGGTTDVVATLSNSFDKDVTVNLTYSGVAAGSGTDYSGDAASIVITAMDVDNANALTITGVDDPDFEGDEDIVIDISSVTNGAEDGAQQVTITITDDDPDINVLGNSTQIENGDLTAGDESDDTDFGISEENSGTVDIIYTIENLGAGNLNLTGPTPVTITGTDAGQFAVQAQPSSPVAATGNTTFTIRFQPTSQGVKNAIINIASDDSDEDPYTFAVTGEGIPDNTAPVITGLDNTPLFIVGGGPIVLDDDVTISDAEFDALNLGAGNYTGGVLTVERATTASTDDNFDFTGTTLTLNGTNIEDGLTNTIATFSESGGTLTITFVTNISIPTTAIANEVIQGITYENTAGSPTSLTLNYAFDDQALTDNLATGSLVVSVNNPPAINNLGVADDFPYTEDSGDQLIDNGGDATITDADAPADVDGATLTVSLGGTGFAEDQLSIIDNGAITVSGSNISHSAVVIASFSGGTSGTDLVVTFNASADLTEAGDLLKAIAYQNTNNDNPNTATRTVSYTYNDGISDSPQADVDVSINAQNDAPVIGNLDGDSYSYAEEDPATQIDQNTLATVTDPDGDLGFNGGSLLVDITNLAVTEDQLTVANQGVLFGEISVSGSNVSYTFTGPNTLQIGTIDGTNDGVNGNPLQIDLISNSDEESMAALIAAIQYQNTNTTDPDETSRNIQFVLNDGTDGSDPANVTFNISGVNDAPVLDNSGAPTLTSIDEDITDGSNTGDLVSAIVTDLSITDLDGAAVEAMAVIGVDNTNGNWEYSVDNGSNWSDFSASSGVVNLTTAAILLDGTLSGGTENIIRFVPDADFNGTSAIDYVAWDKSSGSAGNTVNATTRGGSTAYSTDQESADITVNAVNDAPFIVPGSLPLADIPQNSDAGNGVTVNLFDVSTEVSRGAANESGQSIIAIAVQSEVDLIGVVENVAIATNGDLTFDVNSQTEGTATIEFTIQDDGAGTDTSPSYFVDIVVTDNEGPTVNFSADAFPLDGATNVKPRTQINFTLNEQVTKGSGDITLFDGGDNDIEIIAITSDQVVLDPNGIDVTVTFSDIGGNDADDINRWLRQGESYYVQFDEGVFLDGNANLSPAVSTTGDWNWSMESDANPDFKDVYTSNDIYSDDNDLSDVPLNSLITLVIDQPVRFTDSQDRDFEIISLSPDVTFIDFNIRSNTPGEVIQGFNVPGMTFDTAFVFDITAFDKTFEPNKTYRIEWGGDDDGFEDTEDDDTPNNSSLFPLTFSTVTTATYPLVEELIPANGTLNADPLSLNSLSIDFDLDVEPGSGIIELRFTDSDNLVDSWDINDPEVTFQGSESTSDLLVIDVSGVDFFGSTDYYININPVAIFNADGTGAAFAGIDDNSTWAFRTDTESQPPTISSFIPADNSSNASVSGPFTITFSELVNAVSGDYITARTYPLGDSLTSVEVTDGAVMVNNEVVTFNLPQDLPGSNTIYFTMDSSFQDNSGNKFYGIQNPNTWNFLTESGETTDPDYVASSLMPADDSDPVTNNPSFSVKFTEPVFANSGNFYINDASDNTVETLNVTADITIMGVTVTFGLKDLDSLEYGTTYHIEWDADCLVDAEGNGLAALTSNTVWNFTTLDDGVNPKIISLSPANNSNGVLLSPVIALEFSENVVDQGGGEIYIRYTDGTLAHTLGLSDFDFATDARIPSIDLSGTVDITLSGNTEYYMEVPSTAFDDTATPALPFSGIAGNGNWSFTTAAGSDATVDLSTVSPGDGSSNQPINTNLVLTFEEPVTASGSNIISIYYAADDQLIESFDAADAESSNGGTILMFELSNALSGATNYYVDVAASAFQDNTTNNSVAIDGAIDWTFSTASESIAPVLTNFSNSGTSINSSTLELTFNEPVVDGGGNIQLYYADGTPVSGQTYDVGAAVSGLGTTDLSVAISGLAANTQYLVQIQSTAFNDNSGTGYPGLVPNTDNWSFTTTNATDAVPPFLSSQMPADGSSGNTTSSLTLTFNEPVVVNSGSITIHYASDGTVARTLDVSTGVLSEGNTRFSIALQSVLPGATSYYVNIDAGAFEDNFGDDFAGISDATSWDFSTANDGSNPLVTSLSPANDATGVSSTTSGSLVLTFNEPMVYGSGNTTIYFNDGNTIVQQFTGAPTFSNGNTTATYNYTVLDGSTEYFVEVDATVFNDHTGNSFAGIANDGSWSFVTNGTETTKPAISGAFTPGHLSTGNPVDPSLTIPFSERIYAGTGSITLTSASQTLNISVLDGTQVTGFGTRTLTISPSTNLFNNESYTVTVNDNDEIKDAAGNFYDGSTLTWAFSTGLATVVTDAANVVCTNGDYVLLDDIVITESSNGDFLAGTGETLILTLPTQFEFEAGVGSASETGTNVTINSIAVTEGTLTLNYDVSAIDDLDEITISGLRVRYTGSALGIYNALRSGGTANMKGNNVVHGQPHLTLTTQDPPAPPTFTEITANTIGIANGDDETDRAVYPGNAANTNNPFKIVLSGTGVSANIYTDAAETSLLLSGLPGGSQPTLNQLGLGAVPTGVYTFYVTQLDADGCESDASTYTVGILNFTNSENNTTYSEDSEDIVTLSASQPNTVQYSGEWTGAGLTNFTYDSGNELQVAEFSAASAGPGDWPIVYTLSRTIGGVTESVQYIENFTVNSSASVFVNPEEQCFEDYTEVLEIEDPGIPGYHLYDVRAFPFVDGGYQSEQSNTLFTKPTLTASGRTLSGWSYNPTTVNAPQGYVITTLLYIRDDATQTSILFHAREDIVVNPLPTVSFVNMKDYYCEDDPNVPIVNVSINGNTQAVDAYDLYSYNGVDTYYFLETINSSSLSPQTISSDHDTVQVSQFQIRYTSDPSDDPNGCTNLTTADFEILTKPAIPTLANDLTGIGSLSGNTYLLEFCEGDPLPDLQAVGDSILWFDNSGNPIASANKTVTADDLFGTTIASGGLSRTIVMTNNTDVNIDLAGFEGCASDQVTILIRAYNVPSAPTLNVSASAAGSGLAPEYLYEYCDGEMYEQLIVNSTLDPIDASESYFIIYDELQNQIGTTTSLSLDLTTAPFNLTGAIGETDFYLSQVNKDNVYGGDAGAEFTGCNGPLTRVTIDVNTIPVSPDPSAFSQGSYAGSSQFYLCEGDGLEDIQLPAPGDNSYYVWYEDDGTGLAVSATEIITSGNGEEITEINLKSATTGTFDANTPGDYVYWVRRYTDENNESGFIGCPSEAQSITITVYPDPDSPTFPDPIGAAVNHINLTDGNTQMEVAYCEEEIGSVLFSIEGLTDSRFIWYESNASATRGQEIRNLDGTTGSATIPVNQLTSQLSGGSNGETQYFLVSQVNNIDPNATGDESDPLWFDGCENEVVDMAFVELTIFPNPDLPVTLVGGELLTQDYYFCMQDVAVDGIQMAGNQDGVEDTVFTWYDKSGSVLFSGDSVGLEDIGLVSQTGNDFYTVFVSQTTHIGDSVALFQGCESAWREVFIYQQPNSPTVNTADRFNINTGQFEYCEDDLINGSVSLAVEDIESNAVYNWYDQNLNLLSSGPSETFNTNVNDIGTYTYFVTQTLYTNDFAGCESEFTQIDFEIFANPDEPAFPIIPGVIDFEGGDYTFLFCEGEVDPDFLLEIENVDANVQYIWFEDESFDNPFDTANAVTIGQIINVKGINVDQSGETEIYLRAEGPGFRAGGVGGCLNNEFLEVKINIGEPPVPAISWEGITEDQPTVFTFHEDNNAVDELAGNVSYTEYIIEDASGTVLQTSAIESYRDQTQITFTDPGTYFVTLIMRTSRACEVSIQRRVVILEQVSVEATNGYLEDFENGTGGWFAEYRSGFGKDTVRLSSWELGQPQVNVDNDGGPTPNDDNITNAASGTNAWVTNLDGHYFSNEQSWVYSPSFDISDLEIPIVSFNHKHYFTDFRDGVVLQVSLDNGTTWRPLGDFQLNSALGNTAEAIDLATGGLNWYTNSDIASAPGSVEANTAVPNDDFNPSSIGWSERQDKFTASNDGWLSSAHAFNLDVSENRTTVRFRFALSTNTGAQVDNEEGFAFDDFRIYNGQKRVLLETFSTMLTTDSKEASDDYYELAQQNSSTLWINYYTGLVNSNDQKDLINSRNISDPAARTGYYGVAKVPNAVIEGEFQFKINETDSLSFGPRNLSKAALKDRGFDITPVATYNQGVITAQADFEAISSFSEEGTELSIRFMIIERSISGISSGVYQESDVLRNVLRKILPSASGIIKSGPVAAGAVFSESVSWKVENIYNPAAVSVITFIQNENTKEVYQVAEVELPPIPQGEISVGFDLAKDNFTIYPNPADQKVVIQVGQASLKPMNWVVFDQVGREVLKGIIKPGVEQLEISTDHLPAGIYMMHVQHADAAWKPKRLVVVHE